MLIVTTAPLTAHKSSIYEVLDFTARTELDNVKSKLGLTKHVVALVQDVVKDMANTVELGIG